MTAASHPGAEPPARLAAQPPAVIAAERLLLRRWQPSDAASLAPVLDSNVAHLAPWIPHAVAVPAPVPELEARLAGYAADFDAGRAWLYAAIADDGLVGGAGLYPRDATGRVPFASADRVEVGYWLRADATGRGHATAATRALVEAALALPGVSLIEIRCDPRNVRSAAVPQRLGFRLAATIEEAPAEASSPPSSTSVWVYETRPRPGSA